MNQCLPLPALGAGAYESVCLTPHTGKEYLNQCLWTVCLSLNMGQENMNPYLPLTTQVHGDQCLPLPTLRTEACESVSATLHTEAGACICGCLSPNWRKGM